MYFVCVLLCFMCILYMISLYCMFKLCVLFMCVLFVFFEYFICSLNVFSDAPRCSQTRSLTLDTVEPHFGGSSRSAPRGAILKHFHRRLVKSRTGDRLERLVRKFT